MILLSKVTPFWKKAIKCIYFLSITNATQQKKKKRAIFPRYDRQQISSGFVWKLCSAASVLQTVHLHSDFSLFHPAALERTGENTPSVLCIARVKSALSTAVLQPSGTCSRHCPFCHRLRPLHCQDNNTRVSPICDN